MKIYNCQTLTKHACIFGENKKKWKMIIYNCQTSTKHAWMFGGGFGAMCGGEIGREICGEIGGGKILPINRTWFHL